MAENYICKLHQIRKTLYHILFKKNQIFGEGSSCKWNTKKEKNGYTTAHNREKRKYTGIAQVVCLLPIFLHMVNSLCHQSHC